VKIEMFNVGWISAPAAVWRLGEDPGRQMRLPVPAYLIEIGNERILIDTGLNLAGVGDPKVFYGRPEAGLFELELEQDITAQVDVSTLTRIVLTHLHFDHVGGLSRLPSSLPIVVQRREWEAGHDLVSIQKNFFYPRDYAGDDREDQPGPGRGGHDDDQGLSLYMLRLRSPSPYFLRMKLTMPLARISDNA
jgi:glyoxylase-like metal-dependent hydrolase (beta-lactamase superfamily II)